MVNRYPLPQIEQQTVATRKVGLGVMGFAEALIRLGIPYRSARAVMFARRLMRFLEGEAERASAELAEERGVFPAWEQSVYAKRGQRRRNATLTSIVPTGTISILAGTSSGIEPLFALSYRRSGVLEGQTLTELNPLLLATSEQHGCFTEEVLEQVRSQGTLARLKQIPPAIRDVFATALEIEPRQHLRIQAVFQAAVGNAVSKTVNLPSESTPAQVAEIYREAHRLRLKGITVYRYGSREQQVLQLGAGEEPYEKEHMAKCDPYQCRL